MLRTVVGQWSRTWGEDAPHDVTVVETSHAAALRAFYGPKVSAPDRAVCLVTLRGDFSRMVGSDGPVRGGVWAALFVDRDSLRVLGFTVRAADAIPEVVLPEGL